MAKRWLSRIAAASAVAGAVMIAGVSGTWADPPGNNGTVKINAQDGGEISNDPHVPCDFQLAFFGFDTNQTATITFTIHPPSGSGDVLLSETRTISVDAAGGGPNDPDEVIPYSGTSFGLDRFTAQPQQGFHVKLTIESAGVPGGTKHKVFWLKCVLTSPSASPSVSVSPSASKSVSPSQPPSTTKAPSTSPAAGGLPVTGASLGGLIATGLALIGAGGALLLLRRRRAARDGTIEL
jgi:LPXTG-motif cell wall-anchored protein